MCSTSKLGWDGEGSSEEISHSTETISSQGGLKHQDIPEQIYNITRGDVIKWYWSGGIV